MVQGLRLAWSSAREIERDTRVGIQKQSEPTCGRSVVLCDDSLPPIHPPGADPAFDSQGVPHAVTIQPAGNMNIRSRMDGLETRIGFRKPVEDVVGFRLINIS